MTWNEVIQNIENSLLKETDPAKRRLYKKVIKETITKLEHMRTI